MTLLADHWLDWQPRWPLQYIFNGNWMPKDRSEANPNINQTLSLLVPVKVKSNERQRDREINREKEKESVWESGTTQVMRRSISSSTLYCKRLWYHMWYYHSDSFFFNCCQRPPLPSNIKGLTYMERWALLIHHSCPVTEHQSWPKFPFHRCRKIWQFPMSDGVSVAVTCHVI